jgi:vancomycin resistance protein YoaR
METSELFKKIQRPLKLLLRAASVLIAVIAFFALIISIAFIYFEKKYDSKILPNIYVANINVGGKTVEEAEKIIESATAYFDKNGFTFNSPAKKIVIFPTEQVADTDIAVENFSFAIKNTLEDAYDTARNNDFETNTRDKVRLLLSKKSIPLKFALNEARIRDKFNAALPPEETAAKDAEFTIDNGTVLIKPEQDGISVDLDQALLDLGRKISNLDQAPIELKTTVINPKIYQKDFTEHNVEALAQAVLDSAPLTLSFEKQKWQIQKKELGRWITLKKTYDFSSSSTEYFLPDMDKASSTDSLAALCLESSDNTDIFVSINAAKAQAFLTKKVAESVDIEPTNSKFTLSNGRVTAFSTNSAGRKLDLYKNYLRMEYSLANNAKKPVKLITDVVKSDLTEENVNEFGIKELVGVGKSNFSGSPSNRRINIRVGASKLHGVLIKPNEEFSLIKHLGNIDAAGGFLPELVIKDNKTIPEYGGGLCQIGTTMFRAALNSGLPITARQNHSYRVPYYEPAGTDATIYDPWPDLRFINDTGNYILIQMKFSGSNISFEFWGTKDGRKALYPAKPKVYNYVKPAPTKIIETLDLKPGQKKCIERAHTGADAFFEYTIVYADGNTKKQGFTSHYKPWQEVCLLGVEKLSSSAATDVKTADKPVTPKTAPAQTATSTPQVNNASGSTATDVKSSETKTSP